MSIRRRWFLLAAVTSLLSSQSVPADILDDGVYVIAATDLAADAAIAEQEKIVILLEFAAEDCPYCTLLEEEFLKPMLRSGDYDNKVMMRVVDIGREITITDFQGIRSSTTALARRFDVDLTPTILLVDSRGRPIGERIVGIWSLDFFGGLLDERIDAAVAQVKQANEFRRPDRPDDR